MSHSEGWLGLLQLMLVTGFFGLMIVIVTGYLSWRFSKPLDK